MKTLCLTKRESRTYAARERCFWRAMRKQPDRTMVAVFDSQEKPKPYWNVGGFRLDPRALNPYPCPYGTPGDDIKLTRRGYESKERTIAAITVEQRNGKWGWLVGVGA